MFSVGYNPIEERVAELEGVTPNSDEGVLVNEDHQSNDGENEDDVILTNISLYCDDQQEISVSMRTLTTTFLLQRLNVNDFC